RHSPAQISVIASNGKPHIAHAAIGSGAYDLLFKPVDVEMLKVLLKRAFHVASLEREFRLMQQRLQSVHDLELAGLTPGPHKATLKEAREAVEREMIQRALRKHSGKIAPAAVDLGISRPTLYELME